MVQTPNPKVKNNENRSAAIFDTKAAPESGGDRKNDIIKIDSAVDFETKEQGKKTDLEIIDNSVNNLEPNRTVANN